eukprot:3255114-Prymnesium_polylepis.1
MWGGYPRRRVRSGCGLGIGVLNGGMVTRIRGGGHGRWDSYSVATLAARRPANQPVVCPSGRSVVSG